jgi:hypothetical protein
MMDRLKETIFWGESATPFYWMCMLVAEQHCNSTLAEGLALRLITACFKNRFGIKTGTYA